MVGEPKGLWSSISVPLGNMKSRTGRLCGKAHASIVAKTAAIRFTGLFSFARARPVRRKKKPPNSVKTHDKKKLQLRGLRRKEEKIKWDDNIHW